MGKTVKTPRSWHVVASINFRDGTGHRVTGEVYGETITDAMDSPEFEELNEVSPEITDRKNDVSRISLEVWEA